MILTPIQRQVMEYESVISRGLTKLRLLLDEKRYIPKPAMYSYGFNFMLVLII